MLINTRVIHCVVARPDKLLDIAEEVTWSAGMTLDIEAHSCLCDFLSPSSICNLSVVSYIMLSEANMTDG